MKKIITILFICCGALCFSCNNQKQENEEIRDENTFLSEIRSLTLSEDYNFPEWLSTATKEMETIHAGDISIIKIRIFECEWQDRKIYVIDNNLKSCMYCEMYYINGEKIEWPHQDVSTSLYSTSKNWKLIYEFGEYVF